MTPGQEALAEAARLESALVYGRGVTEHKQALGLTALQAEAALTDALHRHTATTEHATDAHDIEREIHAGRSTHQIIEQLHVTYSEVRAVRKKIMRGAA